MQLKHFIVKRKLMKSMFYYGVGGASQQHRSGGHQRAILF